MFYAVLFLTHICSWWVVLFLISIIRQTTYLHFMPKDCLRAGIVSFTLNLCILFLIKGGKIFG